MTDSFPATLPVSFGGPDIGPHRGWTDVRGWLLFDHLPPAVQTAEDGTANADHERRHWRRSVERIRPATDTERELLTHLGFTVPDTLETVVTYPASGIRRRDWPALTDQQKDMP